MMLSHGSMWTWMCSLLLAATLSSLVSGARPRLESTCDTLANKIHITKEEFNKAKELMRTCEEDVSLNKCEGTCVSGIKPSAIDRSGFSKVSERIVNKFKLIC